MPGGPSWKEKAIDPPDGVRSDTWVPSELFWRVKELYQRMSDAGVRVLGPSRDLTRN